MTAKQRRTLKAVFAIPTRANVRFADVTALTNTMTNKGYTARVEYDPRDEIFVGRVLGLADRITFHGATVAKLRRDFHASIDHYLADCAARGRRAHKPYSGKILLRVPPEVHARAATTAEAQGKSLNQWAAEVLARAS